MTDIDEQGRPLPPVAGDEQATLVGFLEFQRATLAWKVDGLDAAGMTATTAATSMTLGGLLKHLAWVEDRWFSRYLHGRPCYEPWTGIDFASDPDWEWRTAADHTPDELRALWAALVERSRTCLDEALARGGLDQTGTEDWRYGPAPTLRWILTHMIEEYARHNGHADLLREAHDGANSGE